jgi:hypothetical protein
VDAEGIAARQVSLDESVVDDDGAVTGFAGWAGVTGVKSVLIEFCDPSLLSAFPGRKSQ